MNESIQQALILLGVGMISVFVVLTLVVLTGHVLIRISNRLSIEPNISVAAGKGKRSSNTPEKISRSQLAVLSAVVDHFTNGQGRISTVRKVGEEASKFIK